MKISLPEKIETVDQAKTYLYKLHKNSMSYHLDDDAHDVVWSRIPKEDQPTEADCDQLNELRDQIHELPAFNACGYLMDLITDKLQE